MFLSRFRSFLFTEFNTCPARKKTLISSTSLIKLGFKGTVVYRSCPSVNESQYRTTLMKRTVQSIIICFNVCF